MVQQPPSLDAWLQEARTHESAPGIGMYLTHLGVVRKTARIQVREGISAPDVTAMEFDYDKQQVQSAIADTYRMDGIFYIRVWLNRGVLSPGDPIMQVLIGGDIRPHVTAALDALVGRLKSQCVTELEHFAQPREERI